MNTHKCLPDSDLLEVESGIGNMVIESMERISSIRAESNADNRWSFNKLPPVLPHELVAIPTRRYIEELVK
jgi:hypothetical protein